MGYLLRIASVLCSIQYDGLLTFTHQLVSASDSTYLYRNHDGSLPVHPKTILNEAGKYVAGCINLEDSCTALVMG